jgi:hypothetical protein
MQRSRYGTRAAREEDSDWNRAITCNLLDGAPLKKRRRVREGGVSGASTRVRGHKKQGRQGRQRGCKDAAQISVGWAHQDNRSAGVKARWAIPDNRGQRILQNGKQSGPVLWHCGCQMWPWPTTMMMMMQQSERQAGREGGAYARPEVDIQKGRPGKS